MKYSKLGLVVLVLGTLSTALPAGSGEAGNAQLGWLILEEDGVAQAPREALENPALVKTHSYPGSVELDNGRVLKLDSNSAAFLEETGSGHVRVRVYSGRVSMTDARGRSRVAGRHSFFVVAPEPPEARPVQAADAKDVDDDHRIGASINRARSRQ